MSLQKRKWAADVTSATHCKQRQINMVGAAGFEPANTGVRVRRLTHLATPQFEPATFCSQSGVTIFVYSVNALLATVFLTQLKRLISLHPYSNTTFFYPVFYPFDAAKHPHTPAKISDDTEKSMSPLVGKSLRGSSLLLSKGNTGTTPAFGRDSRTENRGFSDYRQSWDMPA